METIRIDGYIGKEYYSLAMLDNAIAQLPKGTTQLTVEINSGGGSVPEGWGIYDRLKELPIEVFTHVIGQASSMGTVIALAAKKANRSMSANADYGIHFPYWQPEAPVAFEAQELINMGEELMQDQKKILELYIEETGQSKRVLEPLMENSKTMTAKEAKQLGFVSNITSEFVSLQRYKIAAFMEKTKPETKTIIMEFSAPQVSWIESQFKALNEKLNKVFTPVFKAQKLELENGSQIFIDADTDEITGKGAFADEQKSALTDGEYVAKDGRTIKVAAGLVAEVVAKKVDNAELDTLKAKVATLEAELQTERTKATTAEATKTELETSVVALKKEVTEFENMVLSGDMKGAEQTFKGQGTLQKTKDQEWLEYKRAKAEANKPK